MYAAEKDASVKRAGPGYAHALAREHQVQHSLQLVWRDAGKGALDGLRHLSERYAREHSAISPWAWVDDSWPPWAAWPTAWAIAPALRRVRTPRNCRHLLDVRLAWGAARRCARELALRCARELALRCARELALRCARELALRCARELALRCARELALRCARKLALRCPGLALSGGRLSRPYGCLPLAARLLRLAGCLGI